MRFPSVYPTIGLLGVIAVAPLPAQELRVRLRDEATRAPLVGALAGLTRDGITVERRLTDAAGRATLPAPGPGTYRLRVDRIGFESWLSEPFDLGARPVGERDYLLPSIRRDLPTIVVVGESQCADRQPGSVAVAALWEEVRLALAASELTLREGRTTLLVREFTEERGTDLWTARRWITRAAAETGAPFRSIEPARLIADGFVRHGGPTADFHGPDATLLLSDEFTATHCFAAREGEGGLVGLGFEPVPGRAVPDIRGTLWVDRATSELRTLEFSYLNLPEILNAPEVGGRVEFERLDDGGWIVRRWHIRMPRLGSERAWVRRQRVNVARLDGYMDKGGTAEVAADPAAVVTHATLMGMVFDSTTGAGMAGVRIEVEGTGEPVLTDDAGRFVVRTTLTGDRLVTARHPKLGLLGRSATRTALLSIGDTTRVEFGVVPVERFARDLCGPSRNRAGIVGVALGPNEVPVIDIGVRATWRTETGRTRQERGRVRSDGLFGLCDLPPDLPITIEVHVRQRVLAATVVELAPRSYQWVVLSTEGGEPPADPGRRIAEAGAAAPLAPAERGFYRSFVRPSFHPQRRR